MLSKLVGSITQALDFNAATLSGCIDIIAVPQVDGTLKSTPFHVRFGKVRVLRSRNKLVDVIVNGQETGICMTLGSAGEAYFTKNQEIWKDELSEVDPSVTDDEVIAGKKKDLGYLSVEGQSMETIEANDVQYGLPFKVELSLCGHLLQGGIHDKDTDRDIFEANKLTYEVASMTPQLWYHSTAVVRFNGKEPHYPAKAAIPMILSALVFKKLPPQSSIFDLMTSVLTCYPGIINTAKTQEQTSNDFQEGTTFGMPRDDIGPEIFPQTTCNFTLCPKEAHNREDEIVENPSALTNLTIVPSTNSDQISIDPPEPIENRTLRPTSDQLAQMKLKWGHNDVVFRLQGAPKTVVVGNIFLWHPQSKIVVSDVDGTITKSDVLGQIAPLLGKDWSHEGVSDFMHKIQSHGYEMLYLTARAIGQADTTRGYLFDNLSSTGGTRALGLPRGPLILSPDRLFSSFKREVIDRTPYIFKIAALRDIRSLFHDKSNPFYAGFGNRDTDHKAYTHVGIPEGKVYIINPNGVVQHVNSAYATSYESMNEISTYMFPPMAGESMCVGIYTGNSHKLQVIAEAEFNDVSYFDTEFPTIDIDAIISPTRKSDNEVTLEMATEGKDSFESETKNRIGKRERLKQWIMAYGAYGYSENMDLDRALDVLPFQELALMFDNKDRKEELERCMSLLLESVENKSYSMDLDNAEAMWDGRSPLTGIENIIWAQVEAYKNVLEVDDIDEITASILNLDMMCANSELSSTESPVLTNNKEECDTGTGDAILVDTISSGMDLTDDNHFSNTTYNTDQLDDHAENVPPNKTREKSNIDDVNMTSKRINKFVNTEDFILL